MQPPGLAPQAPLSARHRPRDLGFFLISLFGGFGASGGLDLVLGLVLVLVLVLILGLGLGCWGSSCAGVVVAARHDFFFFWFFFLVTEV